MGAAVSGIAEGVAAGAPREAEANAAVEEVEGVIAAAARHRDDAGRLGGTGQRQLIANAIQEQAFNGADLGELTIDDRAPIGEDKGVGARTSINRNRTAEGGDAGLNRVIARSSGDDVVAASAIDRVVARSGTDDVRGGAADDGHAAAAVDRERMGGGSKLEGESIHAAAEREREIWIVNADGGFGVRA